MSLYVVIPAYNEELNIERCVDDWYSVVEKHNDGGTSRLVIVNDGSKDQTYEKLQKLAADRPLLIPLTKENGGHGSAVLFGYRYAIEAGAEWVFQTDSDGQTNPAEFEQFWEARNEYDAVIGYRTERGDGKNRVFVEKVTNIMLTTYYVYFRDRVLFLPISFSSRKAGKNSINLKRIIKIGWTAVGDFYRLRRNIDA